MKSIEQIEFHKEYEEEFCVFLNNEQISVPFHWHKHYELLYLLEGNGDIKFDKHDVHLEKGDFLFISAYQNHGTMNLKNTKFLVIQFKPSIIDSEHRRYFEIKYLIEMLNTSYSFNIDENMHKAIRATFNEINTAFAKNEIGSMTLIKGDVLRIIGLMLNHGYIKLPILSNKNKGIDRIFNVLQYIDKQYTQSIDVKEAAKIAGYNYYYFCELFKEIIGQTFINYVNQLRINDAQKLLVTTDLPITLISEKVGFNNLSHFNRQFKKICNLTPSKFRVKNRKTSYIVHE